MLNPFIIGSLEDPPNLACIANNKRKINLEKLQLQFFKKRMERC